MMKLAEEATAALSARSDITGSMVFPEPAAGILEIRYRPAPAGVVDLESLHSELGGGGLARSAVQYTLLEDPSLEVEPMLAVGGETISTGCTAGFTVHDSNFAGISTAGHCPNDLFASYAVPGLGIEAVVFQSAAQELWGLTGDVQWHYFANEMLSITNKFVYTQSGGQRQALATANPVVGAAICYYGRITFNHCATVDKINMCGTDPDSGVEVCQIVTTNAHLSQPGDSGGPWYWNNNAQGIHWAG